MADLGFDPFSFFGNILGGGQTSATGTAPTGDAASGLYSTLMGGDSALAKQLAAARFQQGLQGLGMGLMKGGAPSRLPVSFGTAAASGMEGLMNAQNNVMAQGLQAAQTGDSLAQAQLRKMQGAQLASEMQVMKDFGEKFGGSISAPDTKSLVSNPTASAPGVPTGDMKVGGALPSGGAGILNSTIEQAAASVLPPDHKVVVTSDYRPGATVAGTGGKSQHSIPGGAVDFRIIGPNGPIPNTGEDTTGMYGQVALAVRGMLPPSLAANLGWGGNFPTGKGEKDLMHLDLGGDRGRYGSLAQMAAKGGVPQLPPAAVPVAGTSTIQQIATTGMLTLPNGQQITPQKALEMATMLSRGGATGQRMIEAMGLKDIIQQPYAIEKARQEHANAKAIDVANAAALAQNTESGTLRAKLQYEPQLKGAVRGAEITAQQNAEAGYPGATKAGIAGAVRGAETTAQQKAQLGGRSGSQADVKAEDRAAENRIQQLTGAEYQDVTVPLNTLPDGTPDTNGPTVKGSVPQYVARQGLMASRAWLAGQHPLQQQTATGVVPGTAPAVPGAGPGAAASPLGAIPARPSVTPPGALPSAVPGPAALAPAAAPPAPPAAPAFVPNPAAVPLGQPALNPVTQANPHAIYQPPVQGKGPGYDQPLVVSATPAQPYTSKIPGSNQAVPLPQDPKALEGIYANNNKITEKHNELAPMIQQGIQQTMVMRDVLSSIQAGKWAEDKAELNAKLKAVGAPQIFEADPGLANIVAKEALNMTYSSLRAAGLTKITNMEVSSAQRANPSLSIQPEADAELLANNLGALHQQQALIRDSREAQRRGWVNLSDLTHAWLNDNPMYGKEGYVENARPIIGDLRGTGSNIGPQGVNPAMKEFPNTAEPKAPKGFPPNAQRGVDGQWYVPGPNGSYLKVVPK